MASWLGFGRTPAKAPAPSRQADVPAQSGIPLELVRYNSDTGKFEVGEDALDVLRSCKTPVGVVSVCGRARQGKSYILNQLLGQSSGFKVAPTVRPCTKGLWMWSSPIPRTAADGSKYHMVLLDTEGIDAFDQTGQYSTQIFSLAVLLSSLFVYNQMGGIDEAALDRLSLVTEMTKHIRVRANEGQSTEAELAGFTPTFLWLLRDFYLQLEDEGHKVTANDYLETALAPIKGGTAAADAKNQIRESIKELFPSRECFTLVRPVNEEEQLMKLETVDSKDLRPEFRQGMTRLTELIFNKAQPKRLGGLVVSGSILAALTDAYVAAINHGAVPTIATAWQGVAESECRRAADVGIAKYHACFDKEGTPSEEAALDKEHARCMDMALEAFREAAVGNEEPRRVNEARLRESLERSYASVRTERLATAAATCEKMLREESAKLQQAARAPGATVAALQQQLKQFELRYDASASGPTKWKSYGEFVRGTFNGLVADLAERERREAQAKAEARVAAEQAKAREAALERQHLQAQAAASESRLASAEARATEASQEAAKLRSHLQATQAKADTDAAKAAQEIADLRLQLSAQGSVVQEVAELRARLASQCKVAEQAAELRAQLTAQGSALAQAQAQVSSLSQQLQRAQQAAAKKDSDLAAQRSEAASQLAAAQAAASGHSFELAALQREVAGAKAAIDGLTGERDALQRQLAAASEQSSSLQAQVSSLRDQLAAAQAAPPPASPVPMPSPMPPTAEENGTGGGAEDGGRPDPTSMTVAGIKEWLMEHGKEEAAWEMASNKKAKKADWVRLMNSVL